MLLHIIIVFEPIAIYLLRFNLVIFSLFFFNYVSFSTNQENYLCAIVSPFGCVCWGGALIPKFRAGQALQSREELGRPPGCQRSLPRALGMVTAAGNQDVRFEPSKQSRLRVWTATGQPGFKFQLCHFLAMSSWINY